MRANAECNVMNVMDVTLTTPLDNLRDLGVWRSEGTSTKLGDYSSETIIHTRCYRTFY